MKYFLFVLYVMSLATAVAAPLTQRERDYAMSQLHATRKGFLDAIADVSEDQWNFKPAADRWSIAQAAEHIVLSEDMLFNLATKRLMGTPAAPEKRSTIKVTDEELFRATTDRSQKANAPKELEPAGKFKSKAELISAFKRDRDRTISYVEKTADELRDHIAPHPAYGALDAYQWLVLLAAHSARHTDQILEVKAAPNYPRR